MLDRRRARELLDEALGRMDADARAVFILFELEERSTLDIAEMLGLAPGTVASRLTRGRGAFEAFLKRVQARTRRQP